MKRGTLLLYSLYQMRKLRVREEKGHAQSHQYEADEGKEPWSVLGSGSDAEPLLYTSLLPLGLTLALNLWPCAARLSHGNSLDP